jgi:hypothetical protein
MVLFPEPWALACAHNLTEGCCLQVRCLRLAAGMVVLATIAWSLRHPGSLCQEKAESHRAAARPSITGEYPSVWLHQ